MQNLNLKSKLLLVVLFPIIGLLFLSLTINYDRYFIYKKLERLDKVVLLSIETQSLIYSLQKERGLSSGYVGNGTKEFKEKTIKQWKETNQYKTNFITHLKKINLDYYGEYLENQLKQAIEELNKIEEFRIRIIELKSNGEEINHFYTKLIDIFLQTTTYTSFITDNAKLSQELYSHSNLLYAIEKMANERGLGTLILSSKKLNTFTQYQFNELINEQTMYLENFEKSINKKTLEIFKNSFKGDILNKSLKMRNDIFNNSSTITPISWFNTMTEKILILQKIDNQIIEQILQDTKKLSDNAKNGMYLYSILCLVILFSVLIIGRNIGINIVNSVNELLLGIDRFFKFVNKEDKNIELIEITSKDEIATISKMINEKILISKKIIDEDIIERAKQLEIEVKNKTIDLKIKNKEYQILLDRFNAHTIATRTDIKGIITYASDKFCETSGFTREELIGQNHNIVRHPDMPKNVYSKLWDTILSGKKYSGEIKNRRKDGSDYWVKLIIVPEYDEKNNIIGFFSVKENIDDKIKIREFNTKLEEKIKIAVIESRKKDELLSYQTKMATMGEMIGVIAHQWKQPLSSLAMTIQSIKFQKDIKDIDEKYINEFVSNNMQLINFMSKTIDDFRNFFKQDKISNDFNILNCINKTLNILSPQLKQSRIELVLDGDDFITFGLQSELQQVIVNIISNARDALLEKNIENKKITITTEIIEKKGIVLIEDNAGGIPSSILEKIFEPYFTTKEENKGTGIGLHISKTIVEDTMKGNLSVYNTKNGACFKIILPLV